MLNSKGERELAYVVAIDDVRDMEGVNNQIAVVGGWTIFVKRDEFKPGDLAVYFEIDSKVPEKECFEFLRKYNFKVKTQKFVKGKVISQGLLIHPKDLGLKDIKKGDFLTKQLGVVYADPDDNARKADNSKYVSMQARHKKFFKTKLGKWLMARAWGRKLCFFFLGKKKDKKIDWPVWVKKTDEERCQNMPWLFTDKRFQDMRWIATEKIDGSSTTFTMKQAKPKKRQLLVCSRNVVFDSPKKEDKNFYKDTEGNIYLEMATKYDAYKYLSYILDRHPTYEYITIQGETYGGGIQARNYGDEHRLAVFNVIYKEVGKAPERLNPIEMKHFIDTCDEETGCAFTTVPITEAVFKLPKTCEELLKQAGGQSQIDGGMREGLVFRSTDGQLSFKAVDNNYLLKYHN